MKNASKINLRSNFAPINYFDFFSFIICYLIISVFFLIFEGNFPIIGVGGIQDGDDAKERIYHGANLIQIYSSLAYYGPPVIQRIATELEEHLKLVKYAYSIFFLALFVLLCK